MVISVKFLCCEDATHKNDTWENIGKLHRDLHVFCHIQDLLGDPDDDKADKQREIYVAVVI